MKKIFGTVLYLRAEKIVVVYIAGGDSDVHERRISGNPTGLKTMFSVSMNWSTAITTANWNCFWTRSERTKRQSASGKFLSATHCF